MQGRVQRANRDRVAVHRPEDPLEVTALHREQLGQGRAPLVQRFRQDHLAHRQDAVTLEEHVLGAAQPDPLRPELPRALGVVRRVGVGAHPQSAEVIGPPHEPHEVLAGCGLDQRRPSQDHPPSAPVESEPVTLTHSRAVHLEGAGHLVYVERPGARHAALAHSPRHHRGVAGHPAPGRENPPGHRHAVKVVWAGLPPHQHDLLPGAGPLGRPVRVEHRLSHCGSR